MTEDYTDFHPGSPCYVGCEHGWTQELEDEYQATRA